MPPGKEEVKYVSPCCGADYWWDSDIDVETGLAIGDVCQKCGYPCTPVPQKKETCESCIDFNSYDDIELGNCPSDRSRKWSKNTPACAMYSPFEENTPVKREGEGK